MQQQNFSTELLTDIAYRTMIERNLDPNYPAAALAELSKINAPAAATPETKDLRKLLWCSIDNDDSADLDQLTYAEKSGAGYKIFVAVADVDALVLQQSAINAHAQQNTTSVYTPSKIFAMLPEKLSTDLTSLAEKQDRKAIVVEVQLSQEGIQQNYAIYHAYVHNFAKLAYPSVSEWLQNGDSALPSKVKQVNGLAPQLRLQDEVAQILRKYRHQSGSLTLETIEPRTLIKGNQIVDILPAKSERANQLIEEFMIAANTAVTLFLEKNRKPVFRRVVRVPKYWDRIVEVAAEYGEKLPAQPNNKALERFLMQRHAADPLRFPDISLTIIKLLGRGEYVVQFPGEPPIGHFGLAIRHYSHSTAPNRRFPDIITQRLIKACLGQKPVPYSNIELSQLAHHCTVQETAADKVARKLTKCAAAVYLQNQLNHEFDALVTGADDQGTWVRLFHPPVEGKVVKGHKGLKVGDKVRVKLIHLDVMNGFIDFAANAAHAANKK